MTIVKKLIRSNSPNGRKAIGLFRTAYNEAKLTEDQAERLNKNGGGEFTKELLQLILKHSNTGHYTHEVVSPNYTYPKEYSGPKAIEEQVENIAEKFGLDADQALEFAKTLPELPAGAEGWFAIPKVSAVAKNNFPTITDSAEQYCEAVKLVHKKLADSRNFSTFREGEITPSNLRQNALTLKFLEELEVSQQGDILIISAQFGLLHRGKSVRRARENFSVNEFGLGAFTLCCMALSHPERYVRWEQLHTDCPGDESSPGADGSLSKVPVFGSFRDDVLRFGTGDVSVASYNYGSVSGFVPQN